MRIFDAPVLTQSAPIRFSV